MLALCVASLVARAEMPVTIVTPENAGKQEVRFSVNIVAEPEHNYARVTLKVWPKSAKYGKIGQPRLHFPNGKRGAGFVALDAHQTKDGEPKSYWCTLAKAHLGSSSISIPCYPEKHVDGVDPDTQSMEYILKLKDFMGKEAASMDTGMVSTNSCFGIPCAFSGKLTPEQEKGVPSELYGAFSIESVRDISEAGLQQILKNKEKVAEETHNGVKYIAVKAFRCVQFSKQVSGMMIVIERYRIVDKQPATRQDHTP